MTDEMNEIECGQLCQETIESLYEASSGLKYFPRLLKRIIVNKAWERRVSKGKVIELSSLRELITTKPIQGWGEDPKKVEAVIRDDPEVLALFREQMNGTLAEHGGDHKSEKVKIDQADGVNLIDDTGAGNSNAYWQARIQRDCPEELESIKNGTKRIIDIRRERGWVPKTKRITLTGEPDTDRDRLIQAWGVEYLAQILKGME